MPVGAISFKDWETFAPVSGAVASCELQRQGGHKSTYIASFGGSECTVAAFGCRRCGTVVYEKDLGDARSESCKYKSSQKNALNMKLTRHARNCAVAEPPEPVRRLLARSSHAP